MLMMSLEMSVARCDVSLSREVARRMMRPRGKRRGQRSGGASSGGSLSEASESAKPWYYRPILRGVQLAASRNFPDVVEALEAEMEKIKEEIAEARRAAGDY